MAPCLAIVVRSMFETHLCAGNLFDEFDISLSFSSVLMESREQGLRSGL